MGGALAELLPAEPEVHGLLAMRLWRDSRREARFSDGELVLLGDHDRSRWNTEQIAAGRAEPCGRDQVGPLTSQDRITLMQVIAFGLVP